MQIVDVVEKDFSENYLKMKIREIAQLNFKQQNNQYQEYNVN